MHLPQAAHATLLLNLLIAAATANASTADSPTNTRQRVEVTGARLHLPVYRPIPSDCKRLPGALYSGAHMPGPQSYFCELALGNTGVSLEDLERGVPPPDQLKQLQTTDPANGRNASTAGPTCGNPTVLSSGNKTESVTDYRAEGVFPLEIKRNYNANSGMIVGMFGAGWMSRFDLRLSMAERPDPESWDEDSQTYTNIIYEYWLFREDGSTIALDPNASGGFDVRGQSPTVTRVDQTAPGEFTYIAASGWKEVYKWQWPTGKIQRIVNPQGVSWNFTYTTSPTGVVQLDRVTHSNGRYLTFTWRGSTPSSRHFEISQISDPDGHVYRYGWTTTFTGTDDRTVTYPATPTDMGSGLGSDQITYKHALYVNPDLRSKWVNGQLFASYVYSGLGRVGSTEFAGGIGRFEYSYDVVNRTTTVRNPLGAVTVFTFSPASELVGSTSTGVHCGTVSTTMIRDSSLLRKVDQDPDGRKTETTFDANGNVSKVVNGFESADAATTTYEWLSSPTRLRREVAPGLITDYRYDARSRIEAITRTNTVPGPTLGLSLTTTFSYTDSDGNGLPEVIVTDGPLPGMDDAVTEVFDAAGNLIEISDSRGLTTLSDYDGSGRPGRVVDPNGAETRLVWDARGRLRSSTTAGQQTVFSYNVFGDLVQRRDSDGSLTTFQYDAAFRPTGVTRVDSYRAVVNGTSSPTTDGVLLSLDMAGNVIRTANTRNSAVLHASHTDFDELGRVRADRGSNGQRWARALTPAGLLESTTDVTGRVVHSNGYDGLGRINTRRDAAGKITTYTYDAVGNLATVSDPRGLTTSYVHDGFGNLLSQTSPDTGTTNYEYNAWGQRIVESRADGSRVSVGYLGDGRVATLTSSRNGFVISRTYTYDNCAYGSGRLCSVTESTGESVAYTYTALGSLQTQTDVIAGQALVTRWDYDAHGQLRTLTYPNGAVATYTTQDGLVRGVAVRYGSGTNQSAVSNALYRPFGPVESFRDRASGLRTYTYDLSGRLAAVSSQAPFGLGYNTRDLITSMTGLGVSAVTYDDLDRVANMTQTSLSGSILYDANGNRNSTAYVGSPTSTYRTSSASNMLDRVESTPFSRNLSYDSVGNVVRDERGGLTDCHDYDAFNRFNQFRRYFSSGAVSCSSPSVSPSTSASYRFNGLNQRSFKNVGGVSTRFVYGQAGELLYEALSSGLARSYVWFAGSVVAIQQASEILAVNTDHLGRPMQVRESPSVSRWSATNRVFDRVVSTDSIGGLNLGFLGQYFDAESGLWQNWHRSYDSTLGRYTQSDPIGLAGGINTYSYVGGNPISFVDPYGLFCVSAQARDAVANGLGTAAGAAAQGVPLPAAIGLGAVAGAFTYGGGETAGGTIAGAVQGGLASRSVGGALAGAAGGLIAGAEGGTAGAVLGGAYGAVLGPPSRMGALNPNGWAAVAGPVWRGGLGGLVSGLVTAGTKAAINFANARLGDCSCGK